MLLNMSVFFDHPSRMWDDIILLSASMFSDPTEPLSFIYKGNSSDSNYTLRDNNRGFDRRVYLGAHFLGSVRDDLSPQVMKELSWLSDSFVNRLVYKISQSAPLSDKIKYIEALGVIPSIKAIKALENIITSDTSRLFLKQEAAKQLASQFWDETAQQMFQHCLKYVDTNH